MPQRPAKLSRAVRTILKMCQPNPLTQKQMAKELGTTQQNMNAWLNEKWLPNPEKRRQMKELYGVPEEDWKIYDEEPAPRTKKAKPKTATKRGRSAA